MTDQPVDRSESIYVDNKQSKYPVDVEKIARAVAFALNRERGAAGDVTVTFVDAAEMADLNKQYRKIDGPTDVLSFSMTETSEGEPELIEPDSEPILGDIVICPEITAANAKSLGHSEEREILEITIHGVLHLLGYEHDLPDDEAVMIARQEELAGMFDEA